MIGWRWGSKREVDVNIDYWVSGFSIGGWSCHDLGMIGTGERVRLMWYIQGIGRQRV